MVQKTYTTNIPWMSTIPNHWKVRRLKSLYNLSKGQGLSKADISNNGENKCLLYGELFTRLKGYNSLDQNFQKTNVEKGVKSQGNEILIPGSTTTTSIDLCNCKALNYPDILLGGDIIVLRPILESILNEYFSYFISSICKPEFVKHGKGVTIHHIYASQIGSMKVCFPPLSDQVAIAGYLDRQCEKIANFIQCKQTFITLLKEQRSALINRAVTKGINPNVPIKDSGIPWLGKIPQYWQVRRLKSVSKSIQTGSTPKSEFENIYFKEGDVNWFTPGDIKKLFISESNRKITKKCIEDNVVELFEKKSILVVGIGATLGKTSLIEEKGGANQQINVITLNEEVNPYFGLYFISSFKNVLKQISNTSTLAILTQTKLKDFTINLPPKAEQEKIVAYIKAETGKIDRAIAKATKEIALMQEYKEAMIAEAVLGKLNHRIMGSCS